MKPLIAKFKPYEKYLKRLVLFFVACLSIRWLHLYVNENLYNFHFPLGHKIDDPTGELLIYALVMLFAYIMRHHFVEFKEYRHKKDRLFSAIFVALSIGVLAVPMSIFQKWNITQIFYYFGPLYLSYIFLYLAIFGKNFVMAFESEHILMSVIIYIYLWFSLTSMAIWKVFAYFTLQALTLFFSLFTNAAKINTETFDVVIGQFNVHIGAPCAGVYSLLLFIMFYVLSVYLNRKKNLSYKRSAIIFVIGFAILFILNVIRIAVILMVGAYYSQDLAINIFHEYLGAVLFILFMYLFLWRAMPLMLTPTHTKPKKKS